MEVEKSHVGMTTCYLCGEVKEILLHKRLAKTLPHSACYDKVPCDKCKGYMKQGIILIGVRDGESGENPYRTGTFAVVRDDAVKRIFSAESFAAVEKSRVAFIEDSTWTAIGLPRENINNLKEEA